MAKVYLLMRVEFDPGEQAQVDWGSFGHIRVGTGQRPLSVFSMVLFRSRAIFLDFSLDQQMETFLRMHRRALDFVVVVPKKIVYDNLKSVVLHHVGSTVQFSGPSHRTRTVWSSARARRREPPRTAAPAARPRPREAGRRESGAADALDAVGRHRRRPGFRQPCPRISERILLT